MKVYSKTSHYLDTDYGTVELSYAPDSDPVCELVGNTLLVGYLLIDQTPSDPLEDFDCDGKIYWKDDRKFAGEYRKALGLDQYESPDFHREFKHEGTTTTLWELAQERVRESDPEAETWQIEGRAYDLYTFLHQEILGPYVVPLYTTHDGQLGLLAWSGDLDRLPSAVWVACDCAKDNIKDLKTLEYVRPILTQYNHYLTGECYAMVVESYRNEEGSWELQGGNEVLWGLYGMSEALEALQETMESTAKWLRNREV